MTTIRFAFMIAWITLARWVTAFTGGTRKVGKAGGGEDGFKDKKTVIVSGRNRAWGFPRTRTILQILFGFLCTLPFYSHSGSMLLLLFSTRWLPFSMVFVCSEMGVRCRCRVSTRRHLIMFCGSVRFWNHVCARVYRLRWMIVLFFVVWRDSGWWWSCGRATEDGEGGTKWTAAGY